MTDDDRYDAAHQRAKQIRRNGDDVLPLLREAFNENDWDAAGYDDWPSYVAAEYRLDKLVDQETVAKYLKTTGIDPISVATILGRELPGTSDRKVRTAMARKKLGKYQVIRPLTRDELKALEVSIRENGILEPVVVDEDGNVIDGHHRALIAARLEIDCPTRVLSGLDEEQKVAAAKELNYNRRQLSTEEKRQIVADELVADPKISNRVIARWAGVSEGTVRTVRKELEASAQITQSDTRVGADGREIAKPKREPKPKPDEPETSSDETGDDGNVPDEELDFTLDNEILSALGALAEAGRQLDKAAGYLDPVLRDRVGFATLRQLLDAVSNAVEEASQNAEVDA